jgi:hypothetical protein
MLDLKIDKDYKLFSDERNIILQKRRIITGENLRGTQVNPENIGKEVWDDVGYYRNARQALTDYTRQIVLKSSCKTFEEFFGLLKEIDNRIKKITDIDKLLKEK